MSEKSAEPLTAETEAWLRKAILATIDALRARLSQESSAREAGWREGVDAACVHIEQ